ncbi:MULTISPECIES: ribokinase [unclassified Pseudodesulfovibrio]|uniref:ribokinase n=1 Tax=unclassified Pseudodesulfovibrio TaxID=2661612 RepID=UPI000FEBC507|nr:MULTISPECIES: ribokinase [unclassified Pseudodesulfovibrio]MCJ2164710.1 ribokinase [Pseudodesulfovibrio sp. S3-i]RWU04101.1 ribokinase [Pseudodesulfovibrio sp. S3]
MPKKKLVVIGSVNADHVLQLETFPRPGETVVGHGYQVIPGGKGANQAVAAARLGADVSFVACVGDDDFGTRMVERFRDDGIDTAGITTMTDMPTGIALIQIARSGENSIAISPEANGAFTPEILETNMALLRKADMVLMQLEIPLETIEVAAREARRGGAVIVLNPAPAQPLPDSLLSDLSVITPNETEAELLTGIRVENESDARNAAQVLHDKGVETVIITLGEKGAYLSSPEGSRLVRGYEVQAVDTTAAGDTFNGAFVAALQQGRGVCAAVEFAHAAAAISVTRIGAQTSIPGIDEVNEFIKANH